MNKYKFTLEKLINKKTRLPKTLSFEDTKNFRVLSRNEDRFFCENHVFLEKSNEILTRWEFIIREN